MTTFFTLLTLAIVFFCFRPTKDSYTDVFKPIPIPKSVDFNSTPTEVLTYMKSLPILNVDTEFISEYINFKTPSHPDDECVFDESILGDLEVLGYKAETVQEHFENEMESAVNNEDHPRHAEALAYYTSDEKGV